MNGTNIIGGVGTTAFLPSESITVSLGLFSRNQIFYVGSLGLPDATGLVKDKVFDFAFPQVTAFATACLGVIAVGLFIKVWKS